MTTDEMYAAQDALVQIRLHLDFAIWLCIKYAETPAGAVVHVAEPIEQGFEEAVSEQLRDHRDDLVTSYLVCVDCGEQYLRPEAKHETCPASKRFSLDECDGVEDFLSRAANSDRKSCGGRMVEIYDITASESVLREQAQFAVMRSGDLRARLRAVCIDLQPQPLADLCDQLSARMSENLDALEHNLPEFDIRLGGRRDLFPRGETLQSKYDDYEQVRGAIIGAHQRLWGSQCKDNPPYDFQGFVSSKPLDIPRPVRRPECSEQIASDESLRAEPDDGHHSESDGKDAERFVFTLGRNSCELQFGCEIIKDVPASLGAQYFHSLMKRYARGEGGIRALDLATTVNPRAQNDRATQAWKACVEINDLLSPVFERPRGIDFRELETQIKRLQKEYARSSNKKVDDPDEVRETDDPEEAAQRDEYLDRLNKAQRVFRDQKVGVETGKARRSINKAMEEWLHKYIFHKSSKLFQHLDSAKHWTGTFVEFKPENRTPWVLE